MPVPVHAQIFRDWQLIILIMIVAGIAFFLLLLGTAIPPLRGNVSSTRDVERPDEQSVRNRQSYSYIIDGMFQGVLVPAFGTISMKTQLHLVPRVKLIKGRERERERKRERERRGEESSHGKK
jgi:hypothetical protein